MTDLGLGNAQPIRRRPNVIPKTRLATGDEPDVYDSVPSQPKVSQPTAAARPANPYAPTGWQAKQRVEFDLRLPDRLDDFGNVVAPGQLCRIMRLEREDLFRLGLAEYLNTFTPLLMDLKTDDERQEAMQQLVEENPGAIENMFAAIDKVVMAVTLKPQVTEDESLVNYGTPDDWEDINFTPVVPLENIPLTDRMFIFGAAFGRSMDDLKSIYSETEGLGGMASQPSIQQVAQ